MGKMDEELHSASAALGEAVAARLGPWVRQCVIERAEQSGRAIGRGEERAADLAARRATAEVVPRMRALLEADLDAQADTPINVLRRAVPYATDALRELGVPPLRRDRFTTERFPDDDYALVPATMAVLGEDVGELAIVWGAAKALAHRRRHTPG